MATAQGSTLSNYNNELVKCIEDLREKRDLVNREMVKEEEEKTKIQQDLKVRQTLCRGVSEQTGWGDGFAQGQTRRVERKTCQKTV